jgi:hypothetical protein
MASCRSAPTVASSIATAWPCSIRVARPIQIGNGDDSPSEHHDLAQRQHHRTRRPARCSAPSPWSRSRAPTRCIPVGKGLYTDPLNQSATQAGDSVQQGYLEGSNVDSLQELVQMITVERSFTATQKALTGLGRLQENLISNILR